MRTSLILDTEIRKMRERMLLTLVTLLLTILLGECRIEGRGVFKIPPRPLLFSYLVI